jgi:hypothetical protein
VPEACVEEDEGLAAVAAVRARFGAMFVGRWGVKRGTTPY